METVATYEATLVLLREGERGSSITVSSMGLVIDMAVRSRRGLGGVMVRNGGVVERGEGVSGAVLAPRREAAPGDAWLYEIFGELAVLEESLVLLLLIFPVTNDCEAEGFADLVGLVGDLDVTVGLGERLGDVFLCMSLVE